MRLHDKSKIKGISTDEVLQLGKEDREAVVKFLEVSHPDALFDDVFLEKGFFWGIKSGEKLISIAGVNAISDDFCIAAIGTITTHPDYRRKGLAVKTSSALINFLLPCYSDIVLNVKASNISAIQCYQKLGFVQIGVFDEVIVGEASPLF